MRSLNLRSGAGRCTLGALGVLVASLWACGTAPVVPTRPAVAVAPVAPVVSAAAAPASSPASAATAELPAPLPAEASASAPEVAVVAEIALESPAVVARFPDPAVSYRTPAFEPGRSTYTSNEELASLLHAEVWERQGSSGPTTLRLLSLGVSQAGVPLEAYHFSRQPVALASTGSTLTPARPVVMLIGQQHGDEPAGSEALIVIARDLAKGRLSRLLDRIDVVMLPRANPDGAMAAQRPTLDGIDLERDHLLLRTPEARAMAQLAREFNPMVVVDLREYTVLGPSVEKFEALQPFDALVQYATVANLPDFVTKASEEWFRRPMLQRLKAQGLSTEWYYTISPDPSARRVSMGGVQADEGRNVGGLRNAVSLMIATRGVGLGRAHLQRRVHTQVTAITSVLEATASHAADLMKLRDYVNAEVASSACRGEMVVEAQPTPSEYDLRMLDPITGADKLVSVTWDSALALTVVTQRLRPCGYWLSAAQSDAVRRLRDLGVQVRRFDATGSLRGEAYAEAARASGAAAARANGDDDGSGGLRRVKVDLVPALIDAPAGSYYVGLDQPLANLAIAALEPDSPSSYLAHGVVGDLKDQARVLMLPEIRATPVP